MCDCFVFATIVFKLMTVSYKLMVVTELLLQYSFRNPIKFYYIWIFSLCISYNVIGNVWCLSSILRTGFLYFDDYEINTKLHGLSPRANYTDRATAACPWSNCQLLGIEGATWPAWQIPTAVLPYSRFSRQEPLLFYQVAPQLYSRGWVDPRSRPITFFCSARESNPGTLLL
jgi:hypothetical protein